MGSGWDILEICLIIGKKKSRRKTDSSPDIFSLGSGTLQVLGLDRTSAVGFGTSQCFVQHAVELAIECIDCVG